MVSVLIQKKENKDSFLIEIINFIMEFANIIEFHFFVFIHVLPLHFKCIVVSFLYGLCQFRISKISKFRIERKTGIYSWFCLAQKLIVSF
jgi:hypothetical protein